MLAVLAVAGMLGGCSGKDGSASRDIDVEQYVTLGEYKGLAVKLAQPGVDEEDLKNLMDDLYQEALSASTGITVPDGITDRAVAEGDVVNIDYTGKKDGVAFEGGTAQDAYLGIGRKMFIDGFEEGLVGAMPGETRDLNLKFPDAYGNTELAGQEVVFTVTVNYIMPEGYHESIIPSLAAYGITGVTDAASMEQYARDYLQSYAEQNYEVARQNAVLDAFLNQCTFEALPEELVQKYEEQMREGIENSAASQNTDADTLCMYIYGMTLDELAEKQVPELVRQSLAMRAVANRENLNITDEELDGLLPQGVLDDVAEEEKESLREDYREYFLFDRVLDYLIENAVITE